MILEWIHFFVCLFVFIKKNCKLRRLNFFLLINYFIIFLIIRHTLISYQDDYFVCMCLCVCVGKKNFQLTNIQRLIDFHDHSLIQFKVMMMMMMTNNYVTGCLSLLMMLYVQFINKKKKFHCFFVIFFFTIKFFNLIRFQKHFAVCL